MTILITALMLLSGGSPQGAAADTPKGDAAKVYAILTRLQDEVGKGHKYTIREADLNAFLKMEVARQAPPGIKSLSVTLGADDFTTHLLVDMDALNLEEQGMAAGLLASLMSGVQKIAVTGTLETADGRGTYATKGASINRIALPASLVDMLLSAIGKRQDPPFDPTRPFRLPHGIQSITVRKGVVDLMN